LAVRRGEVVAVRGTSGQNPTLPHAVEEVTGRGCPVWLLLDSGARSGSVSQLPPREQINLPVQVQLIVELYSK
jgi:small subunit ribosomal protein S4